MLEFEFAGAYEVLDYRSNAADATYPITIIGPQTSRRVRLVIRGNINRSSFYSSLPDSTFSLAHRPCRWP